MNLFCKYKLIKVSRFVSNLFHVFPINNNKIIFISFGGEQISCNPLYIYKIMSKEFPEYYKFFWVAKNPKREIFKNVRTIKYGSLSFVYNMMTAKCIITNDSLPTYLKFSRFQYVVNTWHGGGLFKQTFGNCSEVENNYKNRINELHNSDTKLYVLSGSAWQEKVLKRRFGYLGECIESGMPRNDLLYMDRKPFITKIKEYFSIPKENGIVLYAPTFRGVATNAKNGILADFPIDIKLILESLEKKFNKPFTFIFRGHHLISNALSGCQNASTYPDMQELLTAADVFISDFSSCLWDFSLTYRPCFIYAPDFDEYAIKPGFESDYNQWPFIITKNNKELCESILTFEEQDYKNKCLVYHNSYGSFENGNASRIVSRHILKVISK